MRIDNTQTIFITITIIIITLYCLHKCKEAYTEDQHTAEHMRLYGVGPSRVDTPGWENGKDKTCSTYETAGWCTDGTINPEFEWTTGAMFNYPEQNCVVCGKGKAEHAAQVASTLPATKSISGVASTLNKIPVLGPLVAAGASAMASALPVQMTDAEAAERQRVALAGEGPDAGIDTEAAIFEMEAARQEAAVLQEATVPVVDLDNEDDLTKAAEGLLREMDISEIRHLLYYGMQGTFPTWNTDFSKCQEKVRSNKCTDGQVLVYNSTEDKYSCFASEDVVQTTFPWATTPGAKNTPVKKVNSYRTEQPECENVTSDNLKLYSLGLAGSTETEVEKAPVAELLTADQLGKFSDYLMNAAKQMVTDIAANPQDTDTRDMAQDAAVLASTMN